MAEDANKTRQVHLTFEIVGPACQNIAGNHHIRGQKKIACSYSDPGGTLKKIKQPLLAATKSVNFGSEGRLETKATENQYACKWQKSNLLNQNRLRHFAKRNETKWYFAKRYFAKRLHKRQCA